MTKARDLANAGTALTNVSPTELGYLDGVTSAVQTQINTKLASSTAATTYQSLSNNFAAGKNVIINGDFGIWQRGTSFSNPVNDTYQADRWSVVADGSGATKTVSQQTFTAGTAPVSGYEGQFFYRFAQTVAGTGATYNVVRQKIEDVRTYAGQTVTFSFWAKADAARTIATSVVQNFGSGGSSQVETSGSSASVTTSWARYSTTIAVPSVSGKTLGTSSWLAVSLLLPVNTAMTIDIWGVQLEAGSTASPFQTATGTKQGELAVCQRYYYRSTPGVAFSTFGMGLGKSTTVAACPINLPVTMRVTPTSLDHSLMSLFDGVSTYPATSITLSGSLSLSQNIGEIEITVASGLAQYRPYIVTNQNITSYLAFNAEL